MGRKDNRPWRKVVKKLRRKRIRQKVAAAGAQVADVEVMEVEVQVVASKDSADDATKYFLPEEEWRRRDRIFEISSKIKVAEQKRLNKARAEKAEIIRQEWEEKERAEQTAREENERIDKERVQKQEEDYNRYLDFLCGDIETPPLSYVMPEGIDESGRETCKLFVKTGACRFFERCEFAHPCPVLSQTLLVPNLFTHFLLQEGLRDEYDLDLGLEYEKSDLQAEFLEFYADVLPEFRKHGTVLQFKVCCNLEAHLRGNVYIQYDNIRSAVEAFRTFNARFYNGRQISVQFVKIDSWRAAICWSFLHRHCVKGGSCNYLHVFRNPTKEFVPADRDFKEYLPLRPAAMATLTSTTSAQPCSSKTVVAQGSVPVVPSTIHIEPIPKPPPTLTSISTSSRPSALSTPDKRRSPSRETYKSSESQTAKLKHHKTHKPKSDERSNSSKHKKHKKHKSKKAKKKKKSKRQKRDDK